MKCSFFGCHHWLESSRKVLIVYCCQRRLFWSKIRFFPPNFVHITPYNIVLQLCFPCLCVVSIVNLFSDLVYILQHCSLCVWSLLRVLLACSFSSCSSGSNVRMCGGIEQVIFIVLKFGALNMVYTWPVNYIMKLAAWMLLSPHWDVCSHKEIPSFRKATLTIYSQHCNLLKLNDQTVYQETLKQNGKSFLFSSSRLKEKICYHYRKPNFSYNASYHLVSLPSDERNIIT